MIDLIVIADIAAVAVAALVLGYLALLSILALGSRVPGEGGPLSAAAPARRFGLLVPAHDEEGSIGKTLASLGELDYPRALFDVFVIADNCTDSTADVARSLGAVVLERRDDLNRGKGHALRWAFDQLLARDPGYDAFVVIDADSVATRNFLVVMDAHLGRNAEAIQAADLVVKNEASWSAEITRLGFTLYNHVRPAGRAVLGCSAGLRGNGMCFSAGLLRRLPWNAFGLTEDLQYGLTLLLNRVKVRYAPGAIVYATMPAQPANAVSQRARWERGRRPVKGLFGRRLLTMGVREAYLPALDAFIDLMTPPLVQMMAAVVAVGAVHGVLAAIAPEYFAPLLIAWIVVLALGLAHVVIGLVAARADARQFLAVCFIPIYAFWKLRLRFSGSGSKTPEKWVRTTREAAAQKPDVPEREDEHTLR